MRFLLFVLLSSLTANAQELFPDDPLEFEPKPVPVKEAAVRKLSDYYDLVKNTLDTPGELNRKTRKSRPAQAVNTLGEPMQGAWWVKRHYYKTMTVDELVAGPGSDHPPSLTAPGQSSARRARVSLPALSFWMQIRNCTSSNSIR